MKVSDFSFNHGRTKRLYHELHRYRLRLKKIKASNKEESRETAPDREEKSLRHVVMVATFLDDNKQEIHLKSKFALLQTLSMLFYFI